MKTNYIILAAMALASLSSCNGWLKEEAPGTIQFDDFFTGGAVAIQTVNACYAPLAWEYNPGGYFSEWYIGDIASDDALKGGQDLADDRNAYDIDNFKVNFNNGILLNYYRAKYQGISRCNLALQQVPDVAPDDDMTAERRDCLVGEARFMRALYYFQLVRVFGGVPLIDEIIDSSDDWKQPRATAEEVYAHIIADLVEAERLLWNKSDYPAEDLGRATKGAAQAMLCKVNLYRHNYNDAYAWGKTWVDNQYHSQYNLDADFGRNFTLAGENGIESVIEVQYMLDPTSDYGEGFGFSRGTFSTILTRPRCNTMPGVPTWKNGWGFNHPTQNLYDEFESGDPRLALTIGTLTDEQKQDVATNYLGNTYYNYKVAMPEGGTFPSLDHDARGPLNYNVMRASDALLLYAEAALESGKSLTEAKWALEEVRARARAMASGTGILPEFPNYNGYADNVDDLRKAIRHERRVELAMEGHRWFDLVRWGIAYDVLNKVNGTYGSTESDEVKAEMANFIKGKNELFPIPAEEIALNPMEQNPGY